MQSVRFSKQLPTGRRRTSGAVFAGKSSDRDWESDFMGMNRELANAAGIE